MKNITPNELKQFFPKASADTLKRNADAGTELAVAKQKPDSQHEPVGTAPRTGINPVRRTVCVTSYRQTLLDERNIWEHYVIDALVAAGILFDDAPAFCKIQVDQVQVKHWWEERTVLAINPWP